jgi:pyruvate-formate lyase-activating enzyme
MTIPYTLTIIDTSGFGDEGTMKTICEFFVHSWTKIDYFNASFPSVSSLLQSTKICSRRKKNVISSVLSIFGKDIRDNMQLLATFTDGSFHPVVEACVAAGLPLKTDPDTQPTDFCKFKKFGHVRQQRRESSCHSWNGVLGHSCHQL